jgi:hypothetical protein
MLRQAIVTSRITNAIALADSVIITANERTYRTPCSNTTNIASHLMERKKEGPDHHFWSEPKLAGWSNPAAVREVCLLLCFSLRRLLP